MAEKLYYQDAYLKEFTAEITDVKVEDGKTALAFDRTAFYPEGGGQGADHGRIRIVENDSMIPVIDVQEEDGEIWHYLDAEGVRRFECSESGKNALKGEAFSVCKGLKGQRICGRIDWERRFDHMQQHSGEHIISGMICSAFGCDNVGFHMGEEDVTIDYNARIPLEEVLQLEEKANCYIWENHALVEKWPSPEELKTITYRSKKELEGDVRLTSFPGADICACCGTHVKSSAEVGLLKITSAHNFHEGTRITLYCGKRAMDFLSMNYQANKKTAVLLSTKEERTAEIVKKQQEDYLELKSRFARIRDDYLEMWAESFSGKDCAVVVTDKLEPEEGRLLADLTADKVSGLTAVFARVVGSEAPTYRYACIDRSRDISELIRTMNQRLHGKGGGRNGFAQGNVKASEKEIRMFFEEDKI